MNDIARRVALLARPGVARDRMREALDQAGANIVLEADPATTDQAAVLAAQPEAALIVLDAATDEALDRFDGLLSNPQIEVFFEEAELAIGRVGWDAARWVRHLRAKLLHSDNVLPPGGETAARPEVGPMVPASPEPAPAAVAKLELSLADIEDVAPVDVRSDMELVTVELGDEAGLADRLWAARESAEVCKQADGRSRVALYRALAMAYDFAVATRRVPDEYAEILDDAGVKAQARAPMTPIVKLVFGIDYDKTRLTEFAAAMSYAERENVDFGGFQEFVEQADGGLKGLVAAERKARRPDKPVEDKAELGRTALLAASPIPLAQLPTNQEFALVLTRRNADGVHEVVELVADSAMLDRALRRSAR